MARPKEQRSQIASTNPPGRVNKEMRLFPAGDHRGGTTTTKTERVLRSPTPYISPPPSCFLLAYGVGQFLTGTFSLSPAHFSTGARALVGGSGWNWIPRHSRSSTRSCSPLPPVYVGTPRLPSGCALRGQESLTCLMQAGEAERALAVRDQAARRARRVRVVARNDQGTVEIEFIAATGTGEGILENRMVLLPDRCRSRSGGWGLVRWPGRGGVVWVALVYHASPGSPNLSPHPAEPGSPQGAYILIWFVTPPLPFPALRFREAHERRWSGSRLSRPGFPPTSSRNPQVPECAGCVPPQPPGGSLRWPGHGPPVYLRTIRR